ncbi:hypothetical protein PB01_00265 [Psychrobacillus glaciei]|uniref:Uncharacterized protein n=1 Tax=Psychrobacillus glaciei TaxID=2283160 RepID=A0A5J6SHZ8_9BACI|nr:hypothetical protein PB01_00265 [Psychrobacillus glaciei]
MSNKKSMPSSESILFLFVKHGPQIKRLQYFNIENIFTEKKDTGKFCRITIIGFFQLRREVV